MNSENFENQLRGQTLRQPPADWRKDIVAAANQAKSAPDGDCEPSSSWWQILFWPAPRAWAGLAAVWVMIFAMQFAADDGPAAVQVAHVPQSKQMLVAMKERQRLYAELLSETDTNVEAEPAKKFIPRPRSEGLPTVVCV
ncbi:MAG TPA: hypothetical protein VMZ27_03345 [Candidatus Saccharimonadales bacterium]|nr:hypothetical protein [Candidatus Saccharimonadales bacterium]